MLALQPSKRTRVRAPVRRPALRRVLLPVDLSLESQKALRYGCALARQYGADVMLFHVVPSRLPADVTHLSIVFHPRRVAAEARERLARWVAAIRSTGLKVKSEVRIGDPVLEICRYARKSRADMIILSTHGHTGLKRFWVGSTTERVLRQAPCPVLVVRLREREFVPLP